MLADFVSRGAFTNIFLYYFLLITLIESLDLRMFSRKHCDNRHCQSFLLRMIPDIRCIRGSLTD